MSCDRLWPCQDFDRSLQHYVTLIETVVSNALLAPSPLVGLDADEALLTRSENRVTNRHEAKRADIRFIVSDRNVRAQIGWIRRLNRLCCGGSVMSRHFYLPTVHTSRYSVLSQKKLMDKRILYLE